ncbi:hypothetical protein KY289_001204 [Solanum tuberosum]|nr:hypothetical protein KY289_001204 [Solanum tuberosum]
MKESEFEKSLSSLSPLEMPMSSIGSKTAGQGLTVATDKFKPPLVVVSGGGGEHSATFCSGGAIHFDTSTANFRPMSAPSNFGSSSSSIGGVVRNSNDGSDGLLPFSDQMGIPKIEQNSSVTSILCSPTDNANLHYQIVFINGVATEVPRGPLDMKAMFGREDLVLYHSSGLPLPVNEYGFILQSLQHGQSYFLLRHH